MVLTPYPQEADMTEARDVNAAQPDQRRGMTDTIIGAAIGAGVGNVVGPVVSKVTDFFINPPLPEPEQPSQIVLPPGVNPDE
jgi:hypothetical protein